MQHTFGRHYTVTFAFVWLLHASNYIPVVVCVCVYNMSAACCLQFLCVVVGASIVYCIIIAFIYTIVSYLFMVIISIICKAAEAKIYGEALFYCKLDFYILQS